MYNYSFFSSICDIDGIGEISCYGIRLSDENGQTLLTVPDVTTNVRTIADIVDTLQREQVSDEHTLDVISHLIQ